jgi:hypothetical protein
VALAQWRLVVLVLERLRDLVQRHHLDLVQQWAQWARVQLCLWRRLRLLRRVLR